MYHYQCISTVRLHLTLYPQNVSKLVCFSFSAELMIECKDDVVVFALTGQEKNITLEGPIAVPEDGIPPYSVEPDPNATISIFGPAGTSEEFMYTVIDVIGNKATCNVTLSIEPGKRVRAWIPVVLWCEKGNTFYVFSYIDRSNCVVDFHFCGLEGRAAG